MKQQVFAREREELSLYFGGLGAAVGLRSAGLEGGGGGVFDERASQRLHLQRLMPRHRETVAKIDLVERVLRTPGVSVPTLRAVFTPIGAGRASWRLHTAFSLEGQTLLGLVVEGVATARLFWDRRKAPEEARAVRPAANTLLAFLEVEAAKLRGNRIPPGHDLDPLLREAEHAALGGLASYAFARAALRRQARESHGQRMAREASELDALEAAALGAGRSPA